MRKLVSTIMALTLLLTLCFPQGLRANSENVVENVEDGLVNAYANKWAVIPETEQAPVVDGELTETFWQNAAVLGDFVTAYRNETVEDGPEYRIAFDDESIYIGGVFTAEEADDLARIELIFAPKSSGTTYYVATIPIDEQSRLTSTQWSPDWRPGSDWRRVNISAFSHELSEDTMAGVWRLEAAIPLSAFELPAPIDPGDEWGVNLIHAYNLNTRPMLSWMPTDTTHYSDASMAPEGGSLSLGANIVDHGRLGSVFFGGVATWALEDWFLEYNGFTAKRLTFLAPGQSAMQYELRWKTPTEERQLLSPPVATADGDYAVLDFTHPAPLRDGLYQLHVLAYEVDPADGMFTILVFDRNDLIHAGLDIAGRSFPSQATPTAVLDEPASAEVLDLLALIPDQRGVPHTGLPEIPQLRPQSSLYRLSEDRTRLIANDTGTEYPNANYPETKTLTAINRKGETVYYPYYEDNEGRKYFFTAVLWQKRFSLARSETAALASTDPLGAARLLYRFAEKSEGFVLRTNNEWNTYPVSVDSGPPYGMRSGYWSVWFAEELNHMDLFMDTYAEIKKTDALDVLSDEVGVDVEREIVENLFMPAIEYVLSLPVDMHNVDPYIWQRLIRFGKLFGQPDYVHRVVEWIGRFMESQFLSDGFWREVSTAYHLQVINNVSTAMNALEGYSDPPGYVSPRTGRRFDNLNLNSEYPTFGQATQNASRLTYPNHKLVPIQDTWAHQNRTPQPGAGPLLMSASGIGRLTVGKGSAQSQLYTMFTPKYGHNHWDPLNLALFAEGQELLPDIGYTYTNYRRFATSTIGHNTVVVDSHDMENNSMSRDGGRVEQFVAAEGAFQAMRASYPGAYSAAQEYSREPWYVPFADGTGDRGYVLDLFRVSGGDRHEYTLQGDANRDAYFRTDLPLEEYGPYLLPPGTVVRQPESYQDFGSAEGHYPGYIYVRDVKQADLEGEDQYRVTLVTMDEGGAEQAKLRITGLLETGGNELYLGRSPSMRSTRLNGNGAAYDNNLEADKYDMPKLVLRRDGTDLESTFVTVMEPYRGSADPRIEWAERLEPDQAPDGAVAVKVTYGGTTDILLSNPRHPDQPLVVGDITLLGEMGLIRLVEGEVRDLYLIGGTLLSKGTRQVTGDGAVAGTVVNAQRLSNDDDYNAVVTDVSVPDEAEGRYAIVTHPDGSANGYRIGHTIRSSGQSVLVLDEQDPGFEFRQDGSSYQVFYPAKQWTGDHFVRIANVDRVEGISAEGAAATGTVSGVVYGEEGVPVQGASVNLTGYANVAATTQVDGTFTLQYAPEGWQRLTVTKSGYARTVSESVYVTASQMAYMDIQLYASTFPVLSEVTLAAASGEPMTATSSKDGTLYLVPRSTPPMAEAIEAAVQTVNGVVYGTSAPAFAGQAAVLNTTGFAEGRYVVYAVDDSDNVSGGVQVVIVPVQLTLVEDTHPLVRYSGGWSALAGANYSGGTTRYANNKDDFVEIPFYGKQAVVIGHRNASGGLADVYVDGVYRTTVDYYTSQSMPQQAIYRTGPLPEGAHVVKLVLRGERSGGSSAYTQVRFDVLRVLSDEETSPMLSAVAAGPVLAGAPVSATSSKDGKLYLVPSGTAETSAVIAAAAAVSGSEATVTAGVYGELDTSGLATGMYRVYAIDTYGNVSQGSDGIVLLNPETAYIDNANGIVRYSGDWRLLEGQNYFLGSSSYANNRDDFVEIPFYGKQAVVVGHRNAAGGLADVYVDGVYKTTVNYYSSQSMPQQEIYDTGLLEEGIHTVKMVLKGERSGGSSTYTQARFDVLRIVEEE